MKRTPKYLHTDISIVVEQLCEMSAVKNGLTQDEMSTDKVFCNLHYRKQG